MKLYLANPSLTDGGFSPRHSTDSSDSLLDSARSEPLNIPFLLFPTRSQSTTDAFGEAATFWQHSAEDNRRLFAGLLNSRCQ
jgi:hypothetical protein